MKIKRLISLLFKSKKSYLNHYHSNTTVECVICKHGRTRSDRGKNMRQLQVYR